jgi:hypothetical protein
MKFHASFMMAHVKFHASYVMAHLKFHALFVMARMKFHAFFVMAQIEGHAFVSREGGISRPHQASPLLSIMPYVIHYTFDLQTQSLNRCVCVCAFGSLNLVRAFLAISMNV